MDDTLHVVLGTPRRADVDADSCSHCGEPIAPAALVIWCDGGRRLWIYCKSCEEMLLAKLANLQWPAHAATAS
jgi:hypothetical protein